MLRKTLDNAPPIFLNPWKRTKCIYISNCVILQCVLVIIGGSTVSLCVWTPSLISFDPYKLASVMYLYDRGLCEMSGWQKVKEVKNLKLSNDTRGFNVLPFRWEPAIVRVSERLSYTTRTYIEISMTFHGIWAALSIAFRFIVKANKNSVLLNIAITVYFVTFIFMACFDLSMAIVYVTHIKKSLTKGMIVRHAGWSVDLQIKNPDQFAGYMPLAAAACWLRGIIFFALNICSCKILNDIRIKMKKKAVLMGFNQNMSNKPIPDPMDKYDDLGNTLYYRAGEKKPYLVNRE